jgi:hypothetical protein
MQVLQGIGGQWLGATVGGLAALLALIPPSSCTAEDLVATLSWTDGAGEAGTMLFQGTANGGMLQGRAYGGNEQLVVAGTIAEDGGISGTLTGTNGVAIGSFEATRNGDELQGTYVVTGTDETSGATSGSEPAQWSAPSSGAWSAPADKMPVPAATP